VIGERHHRVWSIACASANAGIALKILEISSAKAKAMQRCRSTT
jgi:hypothetical protein